jgi:hypothetical protein
VFCEYPFASLKTLAASGMPNKLHAFILSAKLASLFVVATFVRKITQRGLGLF